MKYFREPYDGKTINISRDEAITIIVTNNAVDEHAAGALLDASTIDDPVEAEDDCGWCEDD